MKICNDKIKDIADEDKQVMYDAMVTYSQYCSKLALSNHVAAKTFAIKADACVDIIKQMRERWEVLH